MLNHDRYVFPQPARHIVFPVNYDGLHWELMLIGMFGILKAGDMLPSMARHPMPHSMTLQVFDLMVE